MVPFLDSTPAEEVTSLLADAFFADDHDLLYVPSTQFRLNFSGV
jgi:hypothetical protein